MLCSSPKLSLWSSLVSGSGACWVLVLTPSQGIYYVCMSLCADKHSLHLQLAESSSPSTVVVKIVKISPAAAPCRSPDSQHTVSILDSSGAAKISFSAVYQPCNLLERPKVHCHLHPLFSSCCARVVLIHFNNIMWTCGQVFHQDVLASLLAPESSQYAVRTALEIFMAYCSQSAFPVLQDMFEDPLGLSEGLTSECSVLRQRTWAVHYMTLPMLRIYQLVACWFSDAVLSYSQRLRLHGCYVCHSSQAHLLNCQAQTRHELLSA